MSSLQEPLLYIHPVCYCAVYVALPVTVAGGELRSGDQPFADHPASGSIPGIVGNGVAVMQSCEYSLPSQRTMCAFKERYRIFVLRVLSNVGSIPRYCCRWCR